MSIKEYYAAEKEGKRIFTKSETDHINQVLESYKLTAEQLVDGEYLEQSVFNIIDNLGIAEEILEHEIWTFVEEFQYQKTQ